MGVRSLTEKDIVYIFVEIRKIIQHDKNQDIFPTIKFFADWVLHIEKDYAPENIRAFFPLSGMEGIDKFVEMEYLKEALQEFLETYEIEHGKLDDGEVWETFCSCLIEVLSEQTFTLEKGGRNITFTTPNNNQMVEYTYA